MNPELQKVLAELAAKLGVTVDHLWGVLLYQAKVEAIFNGFLFALCVAYFIGGGRLLRKTYLRQLEDSYEPDEGWWMGLCIYLVIGFFVLIFMLIAAHDVITQTANPEFWALKQIIGGE